MTKKKFVSLIAALSFLGLMSELPCFAYGAQDSLKSKSFEFQFRVSEIGNLAHQLDCLSGIAQDNDAGYRKFWVAKLNWSKDDDARLTVWRDLNQKYQGKLKIERAEETKLQYPINGAAIDSILIQDRLRFASLLSSNPEEYRRHIELLVLPADVNKFIGVVMHFYPRFHSWWQAEAQQVLIARSEQYVKLIREKSLLELSEQAAAFYGAQVPDNYVIFFHLLFKPMSLSAHSEQVENHALLEVREKEVVSSQLPSLIHELCHHLIRLAPRPQQERLARAFIENPLPYSLSVYNLLDEALASAVGNGLVVKRLVSEEAFKKYQEREKSFYSDPFIDRAAKALMPTVARRMAEGSSMYSGDFTKEYLSVVGDALGELKNSPMLSLKIMSGIFNPAQRPAYWKLLEIVSSGSAFGFDSLGSSEGWDFLNRHTGLNSVIFLLKTELPELQHKGVLLGKENLKRIGKLASSNKAFVYGIRRSPKSHIYVFVGSDSDSLMNLITMFAKSKAGFEQVGVQLDMEEKKP